MAGMTTMTSSWVPGDSLALRLVLVRHALGVSQREAAARCGLTFGEWQSIEAGRKARGLDEKVAKISDSLGVDRMWLMWGGPLGTGPYPGGPRGGNTAQPVTKEYPGTIPDGFAPLLTPFLRAA